MAGAVLAHACPALGPRVAPLLTALLLLVAAWTSSAQKNRCQSPCENLAHVLSAKMYLVKQGNCSSTSQT